MQIFFSSTFVKEETLEEARIHYPIKLEYYKITNEENSKFGIKIIKKEYKKEGTKRNNKKIPYVSNDENEIEKILKTLERNEVTPSGLEDVLKELTI